jgi:type IV pilus assembly protein PilN
MRLNINLATQPYEDGRRFWLRWGTGLALAAIVTLGLVITAASAWMATRKDQAEISSLQDQIAKCEQERVKAQAVLDRPENRSTRDQSQFINGLIRRKAFSWTQVFADLERMMPPQLHVTSIHPELSKDNQLQIKLSVAGQSRDRALQLVHHMEQSPRFYLPQVYEESATPGQAGGDTVHFEIDSVYIPQAEAPTGKSKSDASTAETSPLVQEGAELHSTGQAGAPAARRAKAKGSAL